MTDELVARVDSIEQGKNLEKPGIYAVRKDAIDHVETHEKETACLLWLSQHAHQESSHNGSLLFFSGPQ